MKSSENTVTRIANMTFSECDCTYIFWCNFSICRKLIASYRSPASDVTFFIAWPNSAARLFLGVNSRTAQQPIRRDRRTNPRSDTMYLMYYLDEKGIRVYTLKKTAPDGSPTQSAHPARFSPDDKFSKQRVACKKRFGLLPTQKPIPEL